MTQDLKAQASGPLVEIDTIIIPAGVYIINGDATEITHSVKIQTALSAPRFEEVDFDGLKKTQNSTIRAGNYTVEEGKKYRQGYNACLDHIAAQGFKIVREVK
jgi:hypothetical protein